MKYSQFLISGLNLGSAILLHFMTMKILEEGENSEDLLEQILMISSKDKAILPF